MIDLADIIQFPKNIEQFWAEYSFRDDKEIYTNGSILIPLFRVEQAREHYQTEPRKKARWVRCNPLTDTMVCTNCDWNWFSEEVVTRYCPDCGAYMTNYEHIMEIIYGEKGEEDETI